MEVYVPENGEKAVERLSCCCSGAERRCSSCSWTERRLRTCQKDTCTCALTRAIIHSVRQESPTHLLQPLSELRERG